MDLATMREQVRDNLGETTADFWSDTEVDRAINNAVLNFSQEARWPWLQTTGTGTLTANDPSMALPEGVTFARFFDLLLTASGDVRPYKPVRVSPGKAYSLREMYYQPAAWPEWFYLVSEADADHNGLYIITLKVVPTPTRNFSAEYMYSRRPATLSLDSDVPDMPDEYQDAVVAWATANLWLKELNGGPKAQEQFQLYQQTLAQALTDLRTQADDDVLAWGKDEPQLPRRGASFLDPRYRIAPTLGP